MAIYALLLAAGLSSRMHDFKPLLPLANKETPLSRNISLFKEQGVTPLVITGHNVEAIELVCREKQIRSIHNADYASGMFSSIQTGCKALPDDAEAFFILPVDIPTIRAATISHLVTAFKKNPAPVTHPVFPVGSNPDVPLAQLQNGEKGHPPLLNVSLCKSILAHDSCLAGSRPNGLSGILEQFAHQAAYVPVADEGILLDMDTPDAYEHMRKRSHSLDIPTQMECLALWNMASLPQNIREHCLAVARMAERLALQLPEKHLQLEQVIAGALLHDVARTSPQHGLAGAFFVSQHGFRSLAPLIESHMDMEPEQGPVSSKELVFLADKMIKDTTPTAIHTRYHMKLEQLGHDPEAKKHVSRRMQRALQIFQRYEEQAGRFNLHANIDSKKIIWQQ